jgi:transposase
MVQAEGTDRRVQRFRSVAEKRRIVELTFEPGASVASVARAHGVNANQVFAWRSAFRSGELADPAAPTTALLPVTVSAPCVAAEASGQVDAKQLPAPGGSIHVEFPGRATISVESGADAAVLNGRCFACGDRIHEAMP